MYAGGTATPFIMNWPRAPMVTGVIDTTTVGHVIDVAPTLLHLAGAEYPETFDGHELDPLAGRSLAPLLWGSLPSEGRALFWSHKGHKALRAGFWKIVKTKNAPWQLFDLHEDPTEVHDLSDHFPVFFDRMKETWATWANSFDL